MKIIIILFLFSFSSFAIVPHEVPNSERLFLRQNSPWWCWVAMSQALFNYHHKPEEHKYEAGIILGMPNSITSDRVEPYSISNEKILFPEASYDYLLDTVLTSNSYKSKLEPYTEEKVLALLNKNQPVMLSYQFHVRMIYGYFKVGREVFYLIHDPGSWLNFNPDQYIIPANSLSFLWNSSPTAIVYLEERKGNVI